MDKKIPPVPPKRPIPQKPNIVRQPPKRPIIKPTSENVSENKPEENVKVSSQPNVSEQSFQTAQADKTYENQTKTELKEKMQEQDKETLAQTVETNIEEVETSSQEVKNQADATQPTAIKGNKKAKKIKKEKQKQEISVEKLNERYKTILLSILSAVCLAGAIVCFVFMVL